MPDRYLARLDATIERVTKVITTGQTEDGGYKGYHWHDQASGIWSTAEIVHSFTKCVGKSLAMERGADYLQTHQNADGGWPFRAGGKSITDVTAWAVLARSHYDVDPSLLRGVEFILRARNNLGPQQEDAWGFTAAEPDRVYSTWIAGYALVRLLRYSRDQLPEPMQAEMQDALARATAWLRSARRKDGSWGPTSDATPTCTSTAVALLTLFMHGDDPRDYMGSLEYLKTTRRNGLWEREEEIVVTQEGYELPQQWFTAALAFRALLFFAEFDLVDMAELHDTGDALLALESEDGHIAIGPGGYPGFIWTSPFFIDALTKYKRFIAAHRRGFAQYLEQRRLLEAALEQERTEAALRTQYPAPISSAYFSYRHELDYQRQVHWLIHTCEVTVKYATTVGLSAYLASRETQPGINAILDRFQKPSLGHWAQLLQALLAHSTAFGNLLQPDDARTVLRGTAARSTQPASSLDALLAEVTQLRNTLIGHGALRTLFEYKEIAEGKRDTLLALVRTLRFLANGNSFIVLSSDYDEFGESERYRIRNFSGVEIVDSEIETASRLSTGHSENLVRYVYFQQAAGGPIINMYPFAAMMFCKACKRDHFFVYNGLMAGDEVGYLSYDCGHHTPRPNVEHLRKRLAVCGVDWSRDRRSVEEHRGGDQ